MSQLLLGAVIALTSVSLVLWLAEKRTLVTTWLADTAEADKRPGLLAALQAHWHTVFASVMVALAVTAFAGEIVAPAADRKAVPAAASSADADIKSTYDKLKTFAASAETSPAPAAMPASEQSSTGGLSDVESMIAKLEERLEKSPEDVAGWRMLGWSYQNTGRPAQARAAYDRAIALDPANAELKAARAALADLPATTASGPTTEQVAAAADMPDDEWQAMINGMVQGLAARLAAAPKDEAGWIKLIRSRMVLGDSTKAAEDLQSAQQAFAGEAAVLDRLAAIGRELGLEAR